MSRAVFLVFLVGCGAVESTVEPTHELAAPTASVGPPAACTLCSKVTGHGDVARLCQSSREAWIALEDCLCRGSCTTNCVGPGEWCDQLGAPTYAPLSVPCNSCAVKVCAAELLRCAES
jgi:hypothetical protein